MSKILITGMSAPQMSRSANKRSLSFAGVMEKVFTEAGHSVALCEPDIEWTYDNLKYYDKVIVGLSPITSLSANKVYGALHIIGEMYDSEDLTLFIDAPHPAQISASLRAISAKPEDLTKPFFSGRKGYQLAKTPDMSKKMLRVIYSLLSSEWPDVLYPSLPWQNIDDIAAELPIGGATGLSGVNLDSYLISPTTQPNESRLKRWASDSPNATWTKNTAKTLGYEIVPIRWNKGWADDDCQEQIMLSTGTLMPQHKGGTWWNYRYAQSMNTMTPIVTEWRESSAIGSSWGVLGSTVESMSIKERQALSQQQTKEYLASIPTKNAARELLEDLVGLRVRTGKG